MSVIESRLDCGSLIYMQDDKVVKITGNPGHPGSRGAFCIKGVHGPITAREHPERPVHPLRRTDERGEGRWEQVSWDTALGEIAEPIGKVKRQYGPLAVAGAVSNHFVSRGVAMTQLLRSVGSPNYMINVAGRRGRFKRSWRPVPDRGAACAAAARRGADGY